MIGGIDSEQGRRGADEERRADAVALDDGDVR
jgi:hypothetical protein